MLQKFTGQERDGGTAMLDYFNARHMSAVLGSFTQPDPMNAGADFMRPQSGNGYGYVLGNHLGLVDPSGMTKCYVGNDACQGKRPSNQFGSGVFGGAGLSWISTTSLVSTSDVVGIDTAGSISYAGTSDGDFIDFGPSWSMSVSLSASTSFTYYSFSNVTFGIPGDAYSWATHGKHQRVGRNLLGWAWNYGNWCGVGGSGVPKDDMDAACMLHDYCYSMGSLNAGDNFGAPNAALQGCNQALCNMAWSVGRQRGISLDERQASVDIRTFLGGPLSNGNGGIGIIGLISGGNACHGLY